MNRTARAAEHPVAARRVPHDGHERRELVLRRRDGGLRPSKRRGDARELDSVDGQQRLERSVIVIRGEGREGQHGPAVARGRLVRRRLVLLAERGPRRGRFLRQDEHVQRGGDAPLVRRPLIPRPRPPSDAPPPGARRRPRPRRRAPQRASAPPRRDRSRRRRRPPGRCRAAGGPGAPSRRPRFERVWRRRWVPRRRRRRRSATPSPPPPASSSSSSPAATA